MACSCNSQTPLAPRKQLAIVCAAAAEAPPAAEAPVVAARKKMGVARSRFSRGSPSKVRATFYLLRLVHALVALAARSCNAPCGAAMLPQATT